MLEQISKELRLSILIQFTNELIKNSKKDYIPQERNIFVPPVLGKRPQLQKISPRLNLKKPIRQIQSLRIPESRLPLRLQYLKPTPRNVGINLGKLNPLLGDPMVKAIECDGADEKIKVRTMGLKVTNIILNKEEIDEIIKKFSESTKIPIQEGIFKVALGGLILTAIISSVVGSKFIIKKMVYKPVVAR
ncbi:MAG: hypothetical protein QF567_02830 [Candidatus Pacearchaeota archaeon]|jgi:hypothetical protein|nr:hypothetical protein [Candidatus Pacearchaeota archaeon]|tara:strand:+ start:135 stop:704 length:570 start_codon:yes stop_codon:yes gene_type:complete